jgi:hypothetical protein
MFGDPKMKVDARVSISRVLRILTQYLLNFRIIVETKAGGSSSLLKKSEKSLSFGISVI